MTIDARLGTLGLSLALIVYAAFAAPRRADVELGPSDELGPALGEIELEIYDRDGYRQLHTPAHSVLIGRSPSAAIRLGDPTVSRLHARIERRGHQTYVEDLGSRNGTLLNGTPLARISLLAPGDRVRVGSTEIVFVGLGEWK